jgi:hypothetical protein
LDTTNEALRIAGPPHWPSPDDSDEWDVVAFVDSPDEGGTPYWALVPGQIDDSGDVGALEPATIDADEIIPLNVEMAASLIREHLRRWLLERGWQVQVSLCKSKAVWRLADCLSIADGGGDRLDDDYPCGDGELAVLSASVCVVQRASRWVIPRS